MRCLTTFFALVLATPAFADGPADNIPANVRPIPPAGIAVPDAERANLEVELKALGDQIAAIEARNDAKLSKYLPDIRIFHKAVDWALRYNEFFNRNEFSKAHALLAEGKKRASVLLEKNEAPWTKESGLIVLGYVSKIDGSTQPYGLVVPESWQPKGPFRHRLDIWFHGRGETLSELNFLDGRMKTPGEFTPEDTFVLHPYGRFCNAAKLAGEIDALEALDDVKSRYKIDEDRISVRGFSMGGASAWHFAVHYPDKWFAANPGAGFSETPKFLDVFQKEKVQPTWYEKTLWQMYDCTDWAENLNGCPTIAYSGELDPQKQAADVMDEALHGWLTHVIGPKTRHQYEPKAKAEVVQRMASLAARGRDRSAKEVHLTTPILKYNQSSWLRIDGLKEHWNRSWIMARWTSAEELIVREANVSAFSIEYAPGTFPGHFIEFEVQIFTGGEANQAFMGHPQSDRSLVLSFHKDGNKWVEGPSPNSGLRKIHGLQGPIDDAFLDSFVLVRPSGENKNEKVVAWVKSESERAVRRWRTQMRGDARVKNDSEITDADIASSNLVLWGDPSSNSLLAKIADKLPIHWEGDQIVVGDRKFSAADYVPLLIYPNPLNPKKYVVLNSSFTYREYDDLNNARQVPKLPDWAIVDVRTPPNSRFPGKVADADFFDESWQLKPPHRDKLEDTPPRGAAP